ncbi:MAG: response regulator [Acidobacteria bacterium]|nr:response regulator [Acidobacteriota bacterium]
MKVLLAEDDIKLSNILRREGFTPEDEIHLAPDGVEAVLTFQDGDWDLVVLDLLLPRLRGVDVLRIIKRARPSVPVMVMSGGASAADIEEALSIGAFCALEKPFPIHQFRRSVQDARLEAYAARMLEGNRQITIVSKGGTQ